MQEKDVINAHVPEAVKQLVAANRMDKVASISTGIEDFSIDKIAESFGRRMCERRQNMRPVVDGLLALNHLIGR